MCIAYRIGAQTFDYVPSDAATLAQCAPVYVEFPGWHTPTTAAKQWKDLPVKARQYLKAICELSGARLQIASVGPGREQTIRL